MALTYNGTNIDNVTFNGTTIDILTFNGTTVWENWKYTSGTTLTISESNTDVSVATRYSYSSELSKAIKPNYISFSGKFKNNDTYAQEASMSLQLLVNGSWITVKSMSVSLPAKSTVSQGTSVSLNGQYETTRVRLEWQDKHGIENIYCTCSNWYQKG